MITESTRVCVTGATRGIGLGVARSFLEDGARVAVNYRSDRPETIEVLDGLETEFPGQVLRVKADVSSLAEVKEMFAKIKKEWGGLDVQVNNAGHNRDGLALMMSEDDWGSVINTDLNGAFWTSRQAAWLMAARKSGSIVNIASVSAFTSPAGQSNYAAAKAGVVAMTKALAKELGKSKIRVNTVAPGLIDTDMVANMSESARADYLARIPGGRLGTVEEVAHTVKFLADPRSSYVNGHCLVVDGGLTA